MRIPINQLYAENVNFACLTGCDTDNEEKLQLLIDKVCATTNLTEVDLKCLSTNRKENLVDILNLIVTKLCSITTSSSGTTIDLSKITLCGKDNTTYTYEECLTVLNICFPNLTLEALLQAIIKRINSYSFLISQLKLQFDTLNIKYNTLKAEIDQLKVKQEQCCP